jgi:hypothetical protein
LDPPPPSQSYCGSCEEEKYLCESNPYSLAFVGRRLGYEYTHFPKNLRETSKVKAPEGRHEEVPYGGPQKY